MDALPRPNEPVMPGTPSGTVPLALLGVQETGDPCHWELVSQPWEALGTPMGAGPFHNRKTFFATPNCILYEESFTCRLRVRALSPEGMLALSVPLRWGSGTSFFDRPLHECGLPLMLPGAAEAVFDAGQRHHDAAGLPYQPMINAALGDFLARERAEDPEATLRRVIREELKPTADAT